MSLDFISFIIDNILSQFIVCYTQDSNTTSNQMSENSTLVESSDNNKRDNQFKVITYRFNTGKFPEFGANNNKDW